MNISDQDKLNWAVDLRRISWWLQTGSDKLAEQFIERGKKLYPNGEMVGKREWSWWMKEIQRPERLKAAERALDWSVMLKDQV